MGKKKQLIFLTNFFISYKSDSKLSLIEFLISTLKALINISHKKKKTLIYIYIFKNKEWRKKKGKIIHGSHNVY